MFVSLCACVPISVSGHIRVHELVCFVFVRARVACVRVRVCVYEHIHMHVFVRAGVIARICFVHAPICLRDSACMLTARAFPAHEYVLAVDVSCMQVYKNL